MLTTKTGAVTRSGYLLCLSLNVKQAYTLKIHTEGGPKKEKSKLTFELQAISYCWQWRGKAVDGIIGPM